MKLRNLAYAAMIAVAFTACSNENDPTPTPDPAGGDGQTYLTVGVKKAVGTRAVTDADINTLAVLVFADGTLENFGVAAPTAFNEGPCLTVSEGEKSIIVLANTVEESGLISGTTHTLEIGETELEDFLTWEFTYGAAGMPDVESALMLSSQIYTETLLKNVHNLLGFAVGAKPSTHTEAATYNLSVTSPVKMYRNVAKINLKEIKFDFTGHDLYLDKYENSMYLDNIEIYALNGNKTTLIASADQWGSLEPEETASGYYGIDAETFVERSTGAGVPLIASWQTFAAGTEYQQADNYHAAAAPFSFYAFENSSATDRTLLVIKGDLTYYTGGVYNETTSEWDEDPTARTQANQYYVISIGYAKADGKGTISWPNNDNENFVFTGSREFKGVMRNLQYDITPTIKGFGAPTTIEEPSGKAQLDVLVDVVDWGTVVQEPEF